MDPIAKRFLWDVISNLSTRQGKTAVILTTHSMNEAQALCTRIGIMVHVQKRILSSLENDIDLLIVVNNFFKLNLQVDGKLKCIGSPQHLKSRYGNHLELEVCCSFT